MNFIAFYLALIFIVTGCAHKQDLEKQDEHASHQLSVWNRNLTNVIIKDIFPPPVSSRIYMYANVAAYEALQPGDSSFLSLAGQLNGLTAVPQPDPAKTYYLPVASTIAFATVGKGLVFSPDSIDRYEQQYLEKVEEIGIDENMLANSIAYGRAVGQHILAWCNDDNYKQTRGMSKHVLSDKPGHWQPTPPDYMPGIEPHWSKIRTIVLDSASQFIPPPPTTFDTVPGSKFYEEAMEVYQAVQGSDDNRIETAQYWDCNPNISFTRGHVMFFEQQLSPGGHWIMIASTVTQNAKLSPLESAETLALTSIALFDGFIACWDEKYRSELIRPHTYINKYIDKNWEPVLQTPAFPEHTSGHSVISTAAATVLTAIFGSSFSFTDTAEVPFGRTARFFNSFYEASRQAAISRLYGGIHYRPAIEYGVEQGKKVGNYILGNVQTRVDKKWILDESDEKYASIE
jgi:hypothetical protein